MLRAIKNVCANSVLGRKYVVWYKLQRKVKRFVEKKDIDSKTSEETKYSKILLRRLLVLSMHINSTRGRKMQIRKSLNLSSDYCT